jgi:hypothetical protein
MTDLDTARLTVDLHRIADLGPVVDTSQVLDRLTHGNSSTRRSMLAVSGAAASVVAVALTVGLVTGAGPTSGRSPSATPGASAATCPPPSPGEGVPDCPVTPSDPGSAGELHLAGWVLVSQHRDPLPTGDSRRVDCIDRDYANETASAHVRLRSTVCFGDVVAVAVDPADPSSHVEPVRPGRVVVHSAGTLPSMSAYQWNVSDRITVLVTASGTGMTERALREVVATVTG